MLFSGLELELRKTSVGVAREVSVAAIEVGFAVDELVGESVGGAQKREAASGILTMLSASGGCTLPNGLAI